MKKNHRSIWLSDLHLGARDVNSGFLLDFLRQHESEYLYLVGDIIDLWKLRRGWFWPQVNSEIVHCIMCKARRGTKVVYIPGNHDAFFRQYDGLTMNGIEIRTESIHETADGRRFLVRHGDEFDAVSQNNRWLAVLGSQAYQMLLRVNSYVNCVRRHIGREYWSIAAFLKFKVKLAVNFISNFEQVVIDTVRSLEVDGLICGHIHHAAMENIGGILYNNTGDWVESCTALIESDDGRLHIMHWADECEILHAEENRLEALRGKTHENSYRNRRLAPAS